MSGNRIYLQWMTLVFVGLSFMPLPKEHASEQTAWQMFAMGVGVLFHLTGIIVETIENSRQ